MGGSKFRKSWGDAKDNLVNGLLFYLKAGSRRAPEELDLSGEGGGGEDYKMTRTGR